MEAKRLLELRAKLKRKKPIFTKQDTHKHKNLKVRWRKPKGLHAKMRLNKKGHHRSIEVGWGSPKEVRGMHKSGLKIKLVNSLKEIENLGKEFGIVVGKTVGKRKKIEILKKAEEKGIKVLNINDVNSYIKKTEEEYSKKKLAKKHEEKEKAEKKKEPGKKKDEKSDLAERI